MRLHQLLVSALVGAGLTVLGTGAAHAEETVLVPLPDVSTPGHASGTVEGLGDTPYVLVGLRRHDTWPGPQEVRPVEAGVATYDLETWGLRSSDPAQPELQVGAVPCAGSLSSSCAGDPVLSPVFDATDVAPDVTWPEDTTVGVDETVSITVADPQGGGDLRATWDSPDGGSGQLLAGREGTFEIPVTDGEGEITLHRCMAGSNLHCDPFEPPVSRTFTVRRNLGTVVTDDGTVTTLHPVLTVTVDTDAVGPVDIDVSVLDEQGQVVAVPAPDVDAATDEAGIFTFRLDAAALPSDRYYSLVGTATVQDATFGPLSGPLLDGTGEPDEFLVDTTPPGIEDLTVTRPVIHPLAVNALQVHRTTRIDLHDAEQFAYDEGVEVRDSQGRTVRHLEPQFPSATRGTTTWDGRDDSGVLVAEGAYTVVAVDPAGNPSLVLRTVTVSHDRGVLRTFRRTVSAAGSRTDTFVGRCSTLRRPALRGWAGSLGFYANTRCDRSTWEASAVSTVHRVRVPAAVRWRDFRVDTYGGHARLRPGSRALIRYHALDGWRSERMLGSRVQTHTGPMSDAAGFVRDQRYLYWGLAAAYGHHWDVRSFTLVLRYYTWT